MRNKLENYSVKLFVINYRQLSGMFMKFETRGESTSHSLSLSIYSIIYFIST